MNPYLIRSAVMALALGFAGAGSAGPIYQFDVTDPAGSDAGGKIEAVSTSYDAGSASFSWEHTIRDKNGKDQEHDSFWLVVSDGPNPKSQIGQYAILFGDIDSNTLWAYEYNGDNNSNSWDDPGNLLQTWSGEISQARDPNDSRTQAVGFTINVSDINDAAFSHMWDGIAFDSSIGVWFHPGRKSTFEIDSLTGGITSYSTKAGYYDTANQTANEIPEPMTLSMLGLGALMLVRSRRKAARVVDASVA